MEDEDGLSLCREVEVLRDGQRLQLSPRMFELLRFFIQRCGETLIRSEILDGAWRPDAVPAERTVDVHIAWLRQRLEVRPTRPRFLLTVRGFGYRFIGRHPRRAQRRRQSEVASMRRFLMTVNRNSARHR